MRWTTQFYVHNQTHIFRLNGSLNVLWKDFTSGSYSIDKSRGWLRFGNIMKYEWQSINQCAMKSDIGESTSKLVNWSLANWHVGRTTGIPTHISFLRKRQNKNKVETNSTLLDSTCFIFSVQFWNTFHQHYLASLSKDYRWSPRLMFQNLMPRSFSDFLPSLFLIFSSIQLLWHT